MRLLSVCSFGFGVVVFACPVFIRFFFFKQKTAYEMRISDWSSDVCSSDLRQADDAEHRREGPDFSDAERHLLLIAVDIMDRRVQRYLKVGSLQERVGQ